MYGANRSLLDLIRGLREHGVECLVLSPGRGELLVELEREGVEASTARFRRWRTRCRRRAPLRLAANLAVMPSVVGRLRAWRPHVIYTNSSLVPVGGWAAFLLGIPHVWHLREFGREDYGLEHDLGPSFFRFWIRRSAAVLAVSEVLRRRMVGELGMEIHPVYNGVVTRERARALREEARLAQGRTRRPRDPDEESYVFAIVGTLAGRKGQEEAIDALARVRARGWQVRLWVVGSGPEDEASRLRQWARHRGVEEFVEFYGYVKDPFEIYLTADAVLVCSRSEAMGRVTAEAMLTCRPVIGYRGGATPELVADGETGLLYDGGPEDLADCMERLVRDPELGYRMGRQGWDRAFPQLTVEAYAERVYGILLDVLDASASTPRS